MTTRVLLHVSASPRGAASYSRRVGQNLIDRMRQVTATRVIDRDLSREPPPYPGQPFVDASLMAAAERGEPQVEALAVSERLIGELEAADLVVISTPMYNFTVPAVLKSWVDHVVRIGRTFRTTPEGKVGLLRDRPVFVAIGCGGTFSGVAARQQDFLTPYLRYTLATVGLHDLSVVRLERLRGGTAAVDQAQNRASRWIEAALARLAELETSGWAC